MPLTRYQIRNEYGLADPELYKAADKDDPEALLEGVAMAGLVGVLRQLGDLAEFAAEIFHDLHEEVMATAARGHGLMTRVQQLEAEFPSIEKAFLSQTDHSQFFSSTGVDWHPNLRMEQSLITRGDLPRFVMDSYEESRGPPRLFLLDKFDVAGAGACLKRYTDPSFFKVETASSVIERVGVQREKKIQKVKKKGSRWRNGDTPEVMPTSHAKLHQLFLEERVENGHPDPARRVKLKRRQLNGSPFDVKSGKSYMEKFVDRSSPEHKVVHEVSVIPPLLKLMSDNSSESGPEIHEISVVSPVEKSSPGKERTLTPPNAQEAVVKPFMDELNGEAIDGRMVKVSDPSVDGETDESPLTVNKMAIEEELAVDVDDKTEGSLDVDHSDDMASEVDNYMDALATMESEMDTDNEYKYKNDQGFLNVEKRGMDSDAAEEQLDVQSNFSDSQSFGIYSVSDDGNSSFKKVRSSSSYSGSLANLAEITPSDSEGDAKVASFENSLDEVVNLSSDHSSSCADSSGSKCHELLVPKYSCTMEDNIPVPGEASGQSYPADSNSMYHSSGPVENSMIFSGGSDLQEKPFNSVKAGSRSPDIDEKGANLDNSFANMSGVPSQTHNDTSFTITSESYPVDELDHEDFNISSDGFVHTSNASELDRYNKCGDDSVIEVFQPDKVGERCVENLVEVNKDESVSSIPDSSEVVQPADLVSEFDNTVVGMAVSSETSTSTVDTSEADSIKQKQGSDIIADISQVEVDSLEAGVQHFEEKMKPKEIYEATAIEEIPISIGKVDTVEGDAVPCEHPPDFSHKLCHEDHISTDDVTTETVQTEDMGALSPSDYSHKPDLEDHITIDDVAAETVESEVVAAFAPVISDTNDDGIKNTMSTRNLEDVEESFSGSEDKQQTVLDLHEAIAPGCLAESEARKEAEQAEVAPTNSGSILYASASDGQFNQEATEQVYNTPLVEKAEIHPCVSDATTALSSEQNQESESKPTDYNHSVDTGEDDLCSSTSYHLEAGASLLDSMVQDDQIDLKSVHPFADEAISNSVNLQTSPTCHIAEAQIPLEQMLKFQYDQHDRRSLLSADEANSMSILQAEQMQNLRHVGHESCIDTSSSHPDLPDQELLLQSNGQELNGTKLERSPFDSAFPTFGSLLEATQVNLEEMPPLPPLPPMQWRLGKIQPTPISAQRELSDDSQGTFPLMQPFMLEKKAQFDFPSSDREILQSSNPFLSQSLEDGQGSQHLSADLVGSSLQSTTPLLLEMPTIAIDTNNQPECVPLDGTQALNPFLTSAKIHNAKPEHGSLALGESVLSSSNPFSLAPSTEHNSNSFSVAPSMEHGTSGQDPLPSQGPPIEPSNQLATEPNEEAKVPKHPAQHSESEQGNSSDKSAVSLTMVGEQQQHDLVPSPAETAWLPSTTLALPPTYDVGKLNGNKLPRPRNPLIDAVAAIDKSKLRKVTERVRPQIGPEVEERVSLLEQIRSKSFNLKPAPPTKPSIQGIQGPQTNTKFAAILEKKATVIRQALAGSDEDYDSDSWSDS